MPRWIVPALIASITLTLAAAAALYMVTRPKPLPEIGVMPDFKLVDQSGGIVTSESYAGKTLLVGFIYTNCPDICPMTTAKMRSIQQDLAQAGLLGDVQLLSFSVDPERDTPDVLAKYAAQYKADLGTWRFLTGGPEYVHRLIVEGFKFGTQKMDQHEHDHEKEITGGQPYMVSHTDRIALVDRQGRIRAAYHTEDLTTARILADLRQLH